MKIHCGGVPIVLYQWRVYLQSEKRYRSRRRQTLNKGKQSRRRRQREIVRPRANVERGGRGGPKKDDRRKKRLTRRNKHRLRWSTKGEERPETRKPIRCRLDGRFATHLDRTFLANGNMEKREEGGDVQSPCSALTARQESPWFVLLTVVCVMWAKSDAGSGRKSRLLSLQPFAGSEQGKIARPSVDEQLCTISNVGGSEARRRAWVGVGESREGRFHTEWRSESPGHLKLDRHGFVSNARVKSQEMPYAHLVPYW